MGIFTMENNEASQQENNGSKITNDIFKQTTATMTEMRSNGKHEENKRTDFYQKHPTKRCP